MKIKSTIGAMIATTVVANAASISLLPIKNASDFSHVYTGDEIWNTTGGAQNGWTAGADTANFDLSNPTATTLRIDTNGTTQASSLTGTNANNGGVDTWQSVVNGEFTIETSIKINDAPNGFRLWLGSQGERVFVELYNDKLVTTNNGGGLKDVALTLNDGAFHTIRAAYDTDNKVHVWVDGVAVSDTNGGVFNNGTNDNRLILGDSTSALDFDSYDVEIASIAFDGSASAVPEPSSTALLGLGGLALILRRRK